MGEDGFNHVNLSANGVTLHAVTAGLEDGPLVILLHGFPELWYAWRRYIPALVESGYRVVVPDQRGYNLSDKPPRVRDYGLDTLAADVVGLMDAEGRKSACIVGHDWGAAVAWWTAMRHADRVDRMAVLNVPHPMVMRRFLLGGDLRQLRRSWYMFFFQLPIVPERAFAAAGGRSMFERMKSIGRPDAFSPSDEPAYLEAWARPGAPRGMVAWYRAALRQAAEAPPEDPRIRPPALMVWGKRDTLLDPHMVKPSLDLCDDGRVVWFEQATHWVQHEEVEGVTRALLDFLPAPDRGQ